MNLIEANHQINMTSDHSVSSNDLFKSHLNVMSFTMFQHCSSCTKHGDAASVSVAREMETYNGDGNSASGENWKELSSSKISLEASINGDSNEETLNVSKTC